MTQSLSSREVESKGLVGLEERLSAHPGLLERIEALLTELPPYKCTESGYKPCIARLIRF